MLSFWPWSAAICSSAVRVYSQRDGLQGLPIAVADAVIDLLNPACVGLIVATVEEAARQFGIDVGLIVIDTYAKGIAANGGDEDKARDQNRAAANLRNVHARLDVHIALVGHTGKDETRGARGSNAHVGDVDVMVQISGDTIKVAQVIKGNDQPERAIAEFKLEAFELGRDEDGDPITTSIVSVEHFDVDPTAGRTGKSKKRDLAPIPKAALHALFECIADNATPMPADPHIPAGVTCVTLDAWRDRLMKLAIINAKGNYREQFRRIRVTLQNAKIIGIWEDFVWPVTRARIASHSVTVTDRDTGITPSRHIRPSLEGGVYVTGAHEYSACQKIRVRGFPGQVVIGF